MSKKSNKRQRDRSRSKDDDKRPKATNPTSQLITDTPPPEATSLSSAESLSSSPSPPASSYQKLQKQFLTSQDGAPFRDLVRDHYQGFVHLPAEEVTPTNFHSMAKAALERLRDANYYQYDIVTAGGKHSSRTFVKRTLVGEPGITYKYLGLRLFAHAWSGPDVLPVMKSIGDLNQHMIRMTEQYENIGTYEYNLTLINFMEPSSHTKIGFKDEAFYGMGKVSVSWHADSSLEKNSSIGVYHCLPTQRPAKWDWKIALRRSPDSGKDAKDVLPIATSTKDGDAYFLLGRFNESHQHCVLSGSEANRISSTHRVAVTKEDTFEYIRKRAKGAVRRFRLQLDGDPSRMDAKVIVFCQRVLAEAEMDWIAQYWLQGAEHDKMHVWWQRPMRALEAVWLSLEEMTCQLVELCVQDATQVPRLVVKGFLLELEARQENRQKWDERRADKIYPRRINPDFQPVERPLFSMDGGHRLEKDLSHTVQRLSKVREQQLSKAAKGSNTVSKGTSGAKAGGSYPSKPSSNAGTKHSVTHSGSSKGGKKTKQRRQKV